MQNMKKNIALFITGILFCLFLEMSVSAAPKYDIEAEFEFGYDDTVKISTSNPLSITVRNKGEAFVGEVQIEVFDPYDTKIIFAKAIEMAENSQKVIEMDVPVYTIQKNFKVFITVKDKAIYEDEVSILRVLPPEQVIMAVITEYVDDYKFLSNYSALNQPVALPEDIKISRSMGTSTVIEEKVSSVESNPIIYYFDNFDELNTAERLEMFDYIYFGQSQSIKITNEQEQLVNEWLQQGHTLMIETGSELNKVYTMLPNSWQIKGESKIEQKESPLLSDIPLDEPFDTAVFENINTKDYTTYEYDNIVLALGETVGNGQIITLCVNLGMEPMASWSGKIPFIENAMATVGQDTENFYNDYNHYSPFNYLLRQVPTEKRPPFIFMLIMFLIYIILIGPILYIILKKKDKRDYAWAIIPAGSILFLFIIYFVGFGTRYEVPILNSISIITLNEDDEAMHVESEMAVFNNKKGKLSMVWDKNEAKIDLNSENNRYYDSYYGEEISRQLRGKITQGQVNKYEMYDTQLWSPKYISATKEIPIDIDQIISISLEGDDLSIHVKNTTPLKLEDTFIKWIKSYIYVGDLNPGEEKSITAKMSNTTYSNINDFIINQFGEFNYRSRMTSKEREEDRKRELLRRRYENDGYRYQNMSEIDMNRVQLIAFNSQNIGYNILFNEHEPESYNSNIVEITTNMHFESGKVVKMPGGMVSPQIRYALDDDFEKMGPYDYNNYDNILNLYERGILQFDYTFGDQFLVNEAKVELSEVYVSEDYYAKKNGQSCYGLEGVIYSIYNYQENVWEEMDDRKDTIRDEKYYSKNGILSFRVDIRGIITDDRMYEYLTELPVISIEGVAK